MNALQLSYLVAIAPLIVFGSAAVVLEWEDFPPWATVIVGLGLRLLAIVVVLHIWLTTVVALLQR